MELILKRIAKKKDYTIGRMFIRTECTEMTEGSELDASPLGGGMEGASSFCDTLEPTWRDYAHGGRKLKGRSAIPEGRYPVVITWSPRLKEWLPLLVNVPMFQGIRIHAGNTAEDTQGCILVGENLKRGMVLNSRRWLKRLKDKIVEAKERGEAVWITVE